MTSTVKRRKCKRFRHCGGWLEGKVAEDPNEQFCSTDCCRIDHGLLDPSKAGDLRKDRKARKK